MNAHIIKIGNSRGIRIPKAILEQTGIKGEVMLTVVGDSLVINPVRRPRAGWDDAFARMAQACDDKLDSAWGVEPSDSGMSSTFDDGEWEWK